MKNIFIVIAILIIAAGGYLFLNSNSEIGEVNETNGPIQSHRSYDIEIVSGDKSIQPSKTTSLVYLIKNDRGEILKSFETVHEKIMHFVVVRKDLQGFQHLHPTFNSATGEFSVDITFPADGPYRMFADFTPGKNAGNGLLLPITLEQDISVGSVSGYKPQAVVAADKTAVKKIGDYTITLALPEELQAEEPVIYSFNVKKSGKDITNLELYLGALGHSVILKKDTLEYIHTHAESSMNMSDMGHNEAAHKAAMEKSGPDVYFTTEFSEAGLHKIFVQFQHEGKVLTADFVVDVRK